MTYPMNIGEIKKHVVELRKQLKTSSGAKAEKIQREIDDMQSIIEARQKQSGPWLHVVR